MKKTLDDVFCDGHDITGRERTPRAALTNTHKFFSALAPLFSLPTSCPVFCIDEKAAFSMARRFESGIVKCDFDMQIGQRMTGIRSAVIHRVDSRHPAALHIQRGRVAYAQLHFIKSSLLKQESIWTRHAQPRTNASIVAICFRLFGPLSRCQGRILEFIGLEYLRSSVKQVFDRIA